MSWLISRAPRKRRRNGLEAVLVGPTRRQTTTASLAQPDVFHHIVYGPSPHSTSALEPLSVLHVQYKRTTPPIPLPTAQDEALYGSDFYVGGPGEGVPLDFPHPEHSDETTEEALNEEDGEASTRRKYNSVRFLFLFFGDI